MKCETAKELLPLYLYGELSFEDENFLEEHLAKCIACRKEHEELQSLQQTMQDNPVELPAGLLTRCRRDLNEIITKESMGSNWLRNLVAGIRFDTLLKPAGALALVAIGFAGGMWNSQRTEAPSEMAVQTLPRVPGAARVRYLEPDPTGRVNVIVEQVEARQFSGDADDDGIRELLISALANGEDPGLRVESIDVLKRHATDTKVRAALLEVLRSDDNEGVRLKALEGLRRQTMHADTRKVLCDVLLQDENPAIRAQVIDLLVESPQADMAGTLQEVLRKEDNGYVRKQTLKALQQMKATAGTF